MSHALISGTMFRAPEQRTAKDGKTFAMASVKIRDSDSVQFVRIFTFSELVQTELMSLAEGDAPSVQGRLKFEIYESNGEPRISISIVADSIIALHQQPRARRPKNAAPPDAHPKEDRQQRLRGHWSGPQDGPDDFIPF
jgi:single-stranded DNA-binding protein